MQTASRTTRGCSGAKFRPSIERLPQSDKPGMDKEGFLDTIRRQYAEDIHEAYIECSHEHGDVDLPALSSRLSTLMRNAKVDGLPQKEFEDLVRSTVPAVAGKITLAAPSQKRAA